MTTTEPARPSTPRWQRLDAAHAGDLADAWLQVHYAAQFATAIGISFLPAQPDDSHTNLEWIPSLRALASHTTSTPIRFRLAVRPSRLAILLVDEENVVRTSCGLHGHTIEDAMRWLRVMFPDFGADASCYTLKRHFSIPTHAVATGAPFDTTPGENFDEISRWYGNAAAVLQQLANATPGASTVRCWPHHFDIATLIEAGPATAAGSRTVGVGLAPGDAYYAEPYFYVNMHPAPRSADGLPPLEGGGSWHTREWIGAVLPASRITSTDQRAQVDAFLGSAVSAATAAVSRV